MATTPEGAVKSKIKAFLNGLANCFWFMPVSTGHGTHGIPDFIVCYKGIFIAIEAKKPGGLAGVTPLQMMQINRINQAMGYAIVADDLVAVQNLIVSIEAANSNKPSVEVRGAVGWGR